VEWDTKEENEGTKRKDIFIYWIVHSKKNEIRISNLE